MGYEIHKLDKNHFSTGILKKSLSYEEAVNFCHNTKKIEGVKCLALVRHSKRGEIVVSKFYI